MEETRQALPAIANRACRAGEYRSRKGTVAGRWRVVMNTGGKAKKQPFGN